MNLGPINHTEPSLAGIFFLRVDKTHTRTFQVDQR